MHVRDGRAWHHKGGHGILCGTACDPTGAHVLHLCHPKRLAGSLVPAHGIRLLSVIPAGGPTGPSWEEGGSHPE